MDPLRSETCWSNFKYFKYFIIILIVSTNYIFVRMLDTKVFESSLMHGTNTKKHEDRILSSGWAHSYIKASGQFWTHSRTTDLAQC
jgi:hypothetical protein